MEKPYQPEKIEKEWQQLWETEKRFEVTEDTTKKKFYCLSMLPYPSGHLHMGHVRNYTIGDVISRYHRMLGENVLQPMGWDAFGLPAENAAIKHGVAPDKWTYENITYMKDQLKRLGFSYDWSREVTTCDPDYYRWEQWFFTKLYEKGLVYKKNALVNWDPVDQTVLANEQVVNGRGWRSGALVEQREIPQWFIKITAYADELLDEIDNLTGWPDQVRTMQRNWIGRSEGRLIEFKLTDNKNTVTVFTTRPETIHGVTFLVLSPQHPLALQIKDKAIQDFITSCKNISVAESAIATLKKEGIKTDYIALHPLTGEKIPVWIGNYVLMSYGTGAVMGVPFSDERDKEFAELYNIPIKEFQEKAVDIGKKHTQYRLRDWGVSRQRYWGAPIPIIYCETCGTVPVPEKDLPITLPVEPKTTCPTCHKSATRETDTFDTFMESSWYYARYTCAHENKKMLNGAANYWLPADQYVGGIEHAVMHLLYARFFHKLMRDAGLVSSSEPFTNLLTQGMVLKDGAKMSKSKGNTVDPKILIEKYGADTVRLFSMFAAPPEMGLEWSDAGVEGASRFLKKLWNFVHNQKEGTIKATARAEIHEILSKILFDYERKQFNTVVSGGMKILNTLEYADTETKKEGLSILLRILFPITPHICSELWKTSGLGDDIEKAPFPVIDKKALESDSIQMVVQVNGKMRGNITAPRNADEKILLPIINSDSNLQKFIVDKKIIKVIVVPNKLINIVVEPS